MKRISFIWTFIGFLLVLAACSDGDYQFRFAERSLFKTVEQPSDGNGWRDKLWFLSDTPFCIAVLCGMAKDCGFKDRMVLFRTCIICRYHSAQSAFIPLF